MTSDEFDQREVRVFKFDRKGNPKLVQADGKTVTPETGKRVAERMTAEDAEVEIPRRWASILDPIGLAALGLTRTPLIIGRIV